MPTKPPSSKKIIKASALTAGSGLAIVSWLRWTKAISRKQWLIGLVTILVVLYGGFVANRVVHGGYCNDWVFINNSIVSVENMTVEKPDGWQVNNCFSDNEYGYKTKMLKDYQIPDMARIAWYLGVSDGWGMYAPRNSGHIEVGAGNMTKGGSIRDMEMRYSKESLPEWVNTTTKRIQTGGKDALQIITFHNPNPNDKHSSRYSYYNDIVIEDNGRLYSLRLWNSWHKAESRDEWVAKYEPVFDKMVSTIKFD
jgi:hypothetical protein